MPICDYHFGQLGAIERALRQGRYTDGEAKMESDAVYAEMERCCDG